MKPLTELLDDARKYADLTGDGALYLAPGVTTAEAHVAAWHAVVVQGGYSTPSREAWRLAVDKHAVDRAYADTAQNAPGALHVNEVNFDLVGKALGAHQIAQGLAEALAATPPQQSEAHINDRGEFTGTDGKLWHYPAVDNRPENAHEGDWLSCDGCNPVVVVNAEPAVLGTPDDTLSALRASYAETKAEADAAKERFDAVKDKLQSALAEAAGNATRAALHVPGFKPMTLTYTEPWTFDSKRCKAEDPATYVKYAKQGQRWTLAESRAKS